MFGQVGETPYDLRFTLLGIPVRVHPVFWITSAFLAWGDGSDPAAIVARVLCIFIAILVHELGHALVTTRFGWRSEIVLYFFGGYATTTHHAPKKNIAVTAAGPLAGFALFFLVWTPLWFTGNFAEGATFWKPTFDAGALAEWPPAIAFGTRWNEIIVSTLYFTLWISFLWNVMNLVPVLPLDGGHISRELFTLYGGRNAQENCIKLSVIASGAVTAAGLWALTNKSGLLGADPLFLTIMFGYLCFQNYQSLQNYRHGPRW